MRVLQEGEPPQRRTRQLWWGGVGVASLVVGTAVASSWMAAAVAVPAVATLGCFAAPRLGRRRLGHVGEGPVSDLLRQLPDDFYLVNGLTVKGSGAIDHVVVGPCGVVVVETKRWPGKVRCDGDRWSVDGWPRRSVSRRINRGAAALRRWLAERHPDMYSASAFIQSMAVFTHPDCQLEINHTQATVVRSAELLRVLHEKSQKLRMPPAVAGRLARSLAAAHRTSRKGPVADGGDES